MFKDSLGGIPVLITRRWWGIRKEKKEWASGEVEKKNQESESKISLKPGQEYILREMRDQLIVSIVRRH